jgi:phosphoglycerate kinase
VIENLLKFADQILIGGAMAYTFMKAQGKPVGKSLVEEDKVGLAHDLLARTGGKLLLPEDHVAATELKENAEHRDVTEIPDGMIGVDIGPATIEAYAAVISTAKTIIWNGPMGVFEKPPFDRGTVAIGKAVAASRAVSLVGGGDSEKAVKSAGVADKISHISTGGGASLEFLAGIELPGVTALPDKT